ncbi:MAG: PKD domain-containing protein [Planctomycetes bacterium]|nr:PKD domain-containing protein [Planctomycetota bacterium]
MRTAKLALVAFFLSPMTLQVAAVADITVGGARPVTVHVPESYDPEVPMPLVVNLHGFSLTAAQLETLTRMQPLSDALGFLYACPQGTLDSRGRPFWNATDACCDVDGSGVDDSGYLRAVIDEIRSALNVDERQVYLAGWSNGGFMCYRMACDHADAIAAIVSFAGMTHLDPARCAPSVPVHVLHWHGTADAIVAYGGGVLPDWPGVPPFPGAVATVEQWALYNGCSGEPDTTMEPMDLYPQLAGAETSIARYAGCDPLGSVELWTVSGGDHTPPLVGAVVDGATTTVFALRAVEWLFAHPKGPLPRAAFTLSPASGRHPFLVALDGSASTTPEGTHILSYEWDLGDGTSAEGATASRTYEDPGRYAVELTIRTDDGGRIDREKASVDVACASGDIAPWAASEVGSLEPLGGAHLEGTGEEAALHLCAAGSAFGPADGRFFFAHREASGDYSITARIGEASGGGPSSSVGVLLAAEPDPASPLAAMFIRRLSTGWRLRFSYRLSAGGVTRTQGASRLDAPPCWVRIERRGERFAGSSSLDGQTWEDVWDVEIPELPSTVLAGAFAAGDDDGSSGYRPLEATLSEIEMAELAPEVRFIRGDCSDDGLANMSDAVFLLGYSFLGTAAPACTAACDFNGDGSIAGVSDAVYLLAYWFLGGPVPPAPFPSCGPESLDPASALPCETPPARCAP